MRDGSTRDPPLVGQIFIPEAFSIVFFISNFSFWPRIKTNWVPMKVPTSSWTFLPVYNPNVEVEKEGKLAELYKFLRSKRIAVIGLLSTTLFTLILLFTLSRLRNSPIELPSANFYETSSAWNALTHLILLPGHGIQWCTEVGKSPTDESCWYLQPYQKGQVALFLAHIRRAIEEAANDPKALLIFSGGQTRPGVGLRTESHSYFSAAEKLGYFTDFDGTNVYDRSVSEDFAKDSLENLMFSVCRFKEITGQYPRKITVVGFPFKAQRFIELHRKAMNFPLENFKYIGVDVKGIKQSHIVDDAYADFKNDLYGCGKKLIGKRRSRNPYNHFDAYRKTCPEMIHYLGACTEEL